MRRLRVYVAGPYSSDNVMGVFKNMRNGIKKSMDLFTYGFAPFVPWLDYQFCFIDFNQELTIQDFYEYSMEWLRVSDVLFVQGSWFESKGTIAEIAEAEKLEIPVYYELDPDLGMDMQALLVYAKNNNYYLSNKAEAYIRLRGLK